jgi:hypothetical protein
MMGRKHKKLMKLNIGYIYPVTERRHGCICKSIRIFGMKVKRYTDWRIFLMANKSINKFILTLGVNIGD